MTEHTEPEHTEPEHTERAQQFERAIDRAGELAQRARGRTPDELPRSITLHCCHCGSMLILPLERRARFLRYRAVHCGVEHTMRFVLPKAGGTCGGGQEGHHDDRA